MLLTYSNDELFIISAAQPMITQWGRGGGGGNGDKTKKKFHRNLYIYL